MPYLATGQTEVESHAHSGICFDGTTPSTSCEPLRKVASILVGRADSHRRVGNEVPRAAPQRVTPAFAHAMRLAGAREKVHTALLSWFLLKLDAVS